MPKKVDVLNDLLPEGINHKIVELAGSVYDEIYHCIKSYVAKKPAHLSLVMVSSVGNEQTYNVASKFSNKYVGMDSMSSAVRACFLGDIDDERLDAADQAILSDFTVDIVQSFATDLYQFFNSSEKVVWSKANLPALSRDLSREDLLASLGSSREQSRPVTSGEEVYSSSWVSSVSSRSEPSVDGKA
ncbi:MAG: hypothetical protein HON23_02275 [Rickettsiales bacterium]|nr:hypothetical protein [Rickettsiales bacterium]